MQADLDLIKLCISTMESNIDTELIMYFHELLKSFTPVGMCDMKVDILYMEAWRPCPQADLGHPDMSTIRDCDIRFCRSLLEAF